MTWTASPASPFLGERNPLVLIATPAVHGQRYVHLQVGPGRVEIRDAADAREIAAKLVQAAAEIEGP